MEQLPQSAFFRVERVQHLHPLYHKMDSVQPPCRLSFALRQVFHSGKQRSRTDLKFVKGLLGNKELKLFLCLTIKIPKIAKDPCRHSSWLHGTHDSYGLLATNSSKRNVCARVIVLTSGFRCIEVLVMV